MKKAYNINMDTNSNKTSTKNVYKTKALLASFLAFIVFISPTVINAQSSQNENRVAIQNAEQNTEQKDEVKIEIKSAKEIALDLERARKFEKDVKAITDRINKNKDEYVLQIRLKFLTNADNLSSITNKIELRINKIEISGENVDSMNSKLAEANENIKAAKALLKTLPAKKSLIDYTEFKKYATTIIEARNNLEEAKNTLSLIISDLKDLVVDKNDDKN